MFRSWRSWVLVVLLVGPVLAYIGFGTLWLYRARLAARSPGRSGSPRASSSPGSRRGGRSRVVELLPPIDWDAPQTFAKIDRDAWALVEEEADQGDSVSLESLTEFDLYIETGRRLAVTLADHYHPLSTDPIENVPVVDVLTALELAAEDLRQLCRQVPGGDMITPSHWKKAVQVAGYIQKANDIYSYLLPIFSPVTGLVRLGTQQWMVKPAWKDMQQNLLRWFFRAYVNRLGMHLIELYSGRLAIGAEQYRRLTRRRRSAPKSLDGELPPLRIAVAGARDSGKSRLIALIEEARGESTLLQGPARGSGHRRDGASIGSRRRDWSRSPATRTSPAGESARDRATRRDAVAEAVEADLLILVDRRPPRHRRRPTSRSRRRGIAGSSSTPPSSCPPPWSSSPGWTTPASAATGSPLTTGNKARGRARPPPAPGSTPSAPACRRASPRSSRSASPEASPFGVVELLLPSLIAQFHRAERTALIRHLHNLSTRSKARRLVVPGRRARPFALEKPPRRPSQGGDERALLTRRQLRPCG